MSEFNSSHYAPPPRILSVIRNLIFVYKLWHEFLNHISKTSRDTLGAKIDSLFIKIIESLFIAGYLPRQDKLPYLDSATKQLDLLKFFLQISWEIKMLDNKKYIALSKPLDEIGKMLYGWKNQVLKTPATKTGENK
ncbi:hypothetical protein A3E35_03700 [Candidatus Giovannonibacteria bacterium RIFCSPHIGHO2_12_FULL_44_22]|nr:MAG: hypothetical protein A3E35_03700 [Candidatus Giovannonibacteria bacterium RIFCSPHIGHO2_12_FULL_44_22]